MTSRICPTCNGSSLETGSETCQTCDGKGRLDRDTLSQLEAEASMRRSIRLDLAADFAKEIVRTRIDTPPGVVAENAVDLADALLKRLAAGDIARNL